MKRYKYSQSGQALVALMIFVVMALAIATAASFMIAANSQAAADMEEGVITRQMADSGIETAYLAILRNNDNYSGETFEVAGGSVTVTTSVVGSTITISSTAVNGKYVKTVESVVTYSNNVLTQVSWKEKI